MTATDSSLARTRIPDLAPAPAPDPPVTAAETPAVAAETPAVAAEGPAGAAASQNTTDPAPVVAKSLTVTTGPAVPAKEDPAGIPHDPAGTAPASAHAVPTAAAAEDSAGHDGDPDSDRSTTDSDEPGGGPPTRHRDAARLRGPVLVVLTVLAAALVGLTAIEAVGYHRARLRAAAEQSVLGPAKTAAARILSYDYRHIEQDATQASAVLTGVFRGQYEAVMRQQIVPQAPKQHAVVQAEVLGAGVTSVSPDGAQAVVLIFANQTVSNTSTPRPRVDQVRVRLTLDRVGEGWLVSKVDAL